MLPGGQGNQLVKTVIEFPWHHAKREY